MEIRQNDYGYELEFALKEQDGTTPVDLTDVTSALFQVVETERRMNIVNDSCVIGGTPTEGLMTYLVKSTDFTKAGNYIGGINLTYGSGKVITTKDIFINVKQKLA